MGMDKASSKAGGFFNLFDWNKKSRKKLFASGTVSPVESKQKTNVSRHGQTMQAPKFIEDDDSGIVSSVKGSDYSCASSVTDEEGHGTRAPGVVARLMGLDTLPSTSMSDNYSTPLFDPRSIQEKCYQKRSLNERGDEDLGRSECYYRKTMELRSQKTPSSPIERFQSEVLPPRTARSFSINQYKLLSPIKNPRFFSGRDAAHIMEAAAKILESAPNMNAAKSAVSSLSMRIQDTKENIALCQRASKLSEFSRRSPEPSSLRNLRGQSLNESLDSQDSKCSARTVSLAVQAKVNVKKREGSNSPSCSTSLVPKEAEKSNKSQPHKSQRIYKNKPQRKAPPAPPGVHNPNNQNPHGPQTKDRSTATKTLVRKTTTSGDSSTGRNRNVTKNRESSRVFSAKEDPEKDVLTSRIKKKRSIDWKSNSSDSTLVGRREKRIQSSITIDEHKKWDEGIKGSDTDVVSFTFTSPMSKPAAEKRDSSRFPLTLPVERDNAVSGDPLSILLEQKLRELTSGFDSSSLGEASSLTSPSSLFPGLASSTDNSQSEATFSEAKNPIHGSCRTRFRDPTNIQGAEAPANHKEPEQENRSPMSTLEATFSTESFASCDVSDSTNGCKIPSLSKEGEEYDVSDSASSSLKVAVKELPPPVVGGSTATRRREAEYVKAVLRKADVDGLSSLDPHLFDQLEKEEQEEEPSKVVTLRRKALFDCVGEFLGSRRRRHFAAGYRAWAKGTSGATGGVDRLAEVAYREIVRWEGVVDFMVEDLVEKDMAPWVDFEVESFEAGVDVEEQILSSIVDDVLSDFLFV